MRLKKIQYPMLAAILLAVIFLFCVEDLRAQSDSNTVHSGIVVLKNGQTMAGEISRQGEKYILQLASGSRIHLAENRVLFTSTTLSEAYWELAARTKPTDLEGQVGVFQWCLRNELFEEGANHLLVLQESRMPARRLAALDFDLQAKRKRADLRLAQKMKFEDQQRQAKQKALVDAARKDRIEAMIGVKTNVRIPDLHRVPLRPIAAVQRAPAVSNRAPVTTEVIDQFGDPVPTAMVRQVSYEQPIFSSPAIAVTESQEGSETGDSQREIPQPQFAQSIARVQPLTNSGNVRRIPKPTEVKVEDNAADLAIAADSQESGFSIKRNSSSLQTQSKVEMSDPFDADYFNRRFATPTVSDK